MAKKRRRSTPRSTKRPERVSHNARIWLATLSTVVGVATGMFTLRDQVFPGESGTAGAVSESAFRADVGEICDELNEGERARVHDDRRLARELNKARTNVAQRDALLDSARRVAARSNHALASFSALDGPRETAAARRATVAVWERNLHRVLVYAERLDRASDRRGVLLAVDGLSKVRTPLSEDGAEIHRRLRRLGAGRCELDSPVVTRTITLPPLPERRKPSPRPTRTPAAPPGTGATPTPTATPEAGASLGPRVNPPTTTNPTPNNSLPRVNPPDPSGPATGAGED
jgi:hypothetical protein